MAVLLGVCNWVHPLLQSPSCCKELKEAGIDAIQLDLGSAEEDFPLSSPGIQRQWKEEAELYGIRLDAVVVLAVLKHGMTAEPGSERRNTAEKAIAAAVMAAPAEAVLRRAGADAHLYVCGPAGFISHVCGAARQAAWVLAGGDTPPNWPIDGSLTFEGDDQPAVREAYRAAAAVVAGRS